MKELKIFDSILNDLQKIFEIVSNNIVRIIIGIIVIVLFLLFRKWLSKNLASIFGKLFRKRPVIGAGIRTSIQDPLKAFFAILGLYLGFAIMGPPAVIMSTLTKFFRISIIVLLTWALANFTPFATSFIIKIEGKSNKKANAVAIKFIANIAKVIIIALSVVVIISELGYNITGLLTGLGLGGLTFSLAAQSTAANLFAGFSIVSDKPFDVGDYIITPSVEGIVEDITMRSTRIRTIADTVIVMPNSKLVDEPITNCSRMGKRYADFKIGLTYDTSGEVIKKCASEIEQMLRDDEGIDDERIVVAFDGFSDSSQDIRVIYFTKATEFDQALKARETVYYKIKEIVESNGASFAFPSTSVYMENPNVGKN
ncbi:MAG: mechanosensitive ion channel family protein [Oscillospiraceae bacterium]|nr:mechanosensitive ion channel family protein [Oscillospiraceae bacterium]